MSVNNPNFFFMHYNKSNFQVENLVMVPKYFFSPEVIEKRKSYATMPYSKIQYFAIQTPGFMELFPDSELFIMFSNSFTAKFEFKGAADIGKIGRICLGC